MTDRNLTPHLFRGSRSRRTVEPPRTTALGALRRESAVAERAFQKIRGLHRLCRESADQCATRAPMGTHTSRCARDHARRVSALNVSGAPPPSGRPHPGRARAAAQRHLTADHGPGWQPRCGGLPHEARSPAHDQKHRRLTSPRPKRPTVAPRLPCGRPKAPKWRAIEISPSCFAPFSRHFRSVEQSTGLDSDECNVLTCSFTSGR